MASAELQQALNALQAFYQYVLIISISVFAFSLICECGRLSILLCALAFHRHVAHACDVR